MSKRIKDLTKTGVWQITTETPLKEDLTLSCLMRIADATEAMAKNYVQLEKDVVFWKREYYDEKNRRESFQRSIRAHKANYTRLKNKMERIKKDDL